MVMIDLSMTLAAAVDAHPGLAREFQRRGLDYCCGGRRTLAEACAKEGLDPDVTVTELAAAAEGSMVPASLGVFSLLRSPHAAHSGGSRRDRRTHR